ncbi:DUF6247 family protein [Nocardiopsis sp. RSe5-2]|uniref:DUF6247 family protein n=1 Tax=Nocardiopsis endophytica TaxID=3018445 RepID=A0ABT4U7E6_9ACTN|nr:DUF6247 family protein [Nocardiopsis endophytica]MDA2812883.1 DUF6247 family protein [Nocardiopsis endophytica]
MALPSELTPTAVRAAIARLRDPELLRRFDEDLDAAFERARRESDLSVLIDTVRRWWFEADARKDPERYREFTHRVQRYLDEGPPPPEERVGRAEILERFGL